MKDIAPELLERLQKAFQKKFSNNVNIRRLNRSLDQGKATYEEANNFALEIGDMLASVFQENLSEKDLPDGRMYYNIGKRVVEPTLAQNYELTSAYCLAVQEELNKQAGLSLKAQKPALNQDRIDGIVDRLSEEEHFEDAKWLLDEPVVNFTQSVVDAAIKTNAKFQYNAGLSPRVVRKSSGKCCDWCNNLAGTYRYPDEVPDDVWRRHRYCRCTVEYDPGDGKRQNVWNKKWEDPDAKEKAEERKELDSEEGIKSVSEAKSLASLKQYMSNKYGIEMDNSVLDLNLDMVKASMSGIESVMNQYPEIAESLNRITTSKNGVMSCSANEITFNPFYYSGKDKLPAICEEQSESGWWIKNSTPASIGAHEAGHAVNWLVIDKNKSYEFEFQKILDWNEKKTAKEIVSNACKEVKSKQPKGKKKVIMK